MEASVQDDDGRCWDDSCVPAQTAVNPGRSRGMAGRWQGGPPGKVHGTDGLSM